MIDNQTQPNNPVLTPEQTQAIEYSKGILLNLEGEISIAQKALKQLKSESERAIKDKDYQEEMLIDITKKVNTASVQLEELTAQINENIEQLNLLREESKNLSVSHEEKSTELANREFVVSKKETELCNKEIDLNKEIEILNTDKVNHAEKVTKLKEVISIF